MAVRDRQPDIIKREGHWGGGPAWVPYVDVPDIKAATKKAQDLGAKVMKDVTEVADMGWLSIIVDPTGAMLGLWQTKS